MGGRAAYSHEPLNYRYRVADAPGRANRWRSRPFAPSAEVQPVSVAGGRDFTKRVKGKSALGLS